MKPVVVFKEKCKGCDICVNVCPSGTLSMIEDLTSVNTKVAFVYKEENCIGCNACELNCPDFAIEVASPKEVKFAKLTSESKQLSEEIKANKFFAKELQERK